MTLLLVLFLPAYSEPNSQKKVFDAEIVKVQLLSKYSGTALLAAIDPRYVVEVRLQNDVIGIGTKGEVIAFAIHSPTRDLRMKTISATGGQHCRLGVIWKPKFKRFSIRREREAKETNAKGSP